MGLDPTSIKLFSYDGGATYTSLGCGRRLVKPDALEAARRAADLDEGQQTIAMGSAIVGITFRPPLPDDQAQIFARTLGAEMGVDQVAMLDVDSAHQKAPAPLGYIAISS